LVEGDNNTKSFHKYANHRRNMNTIWEISKPNRNKVNSFKEIAEVGKQHFKTLFKDPKIANIGEIMKIYDSSLGSLIIK
jgi:hypothetical protein